MSSRASDRKTLSLLLPALIGLLIGCRSAPGTIAAPTPAAAPVPAPAAVATKPEPPPASHPAFDGERAYALLKKQCDFGPRPLGSEAHERLRAFLIEEMKRYADQTVLQTFTYRGMPVTNVIGVFYPEGAKEPSQHPVLLLAHWDTRPIADGPFSSEVRHGAPFVYGPRGWNRTTPIPGADDGASGVAVLLELARLFKEKRPSVGVLLLLDDGEDYGDFRGGGGEGDGVELGSRYFADHFRENKIFGQPDYGILLDMVGAKNLIIPRENRSQMYAPGTNEKVFRIAQSLGYGDIFRSDALQEVGDDHIALNEKGIPTIDLIHPLPFSPYETTGYTYWHTLQDSADKCSAKSLKVVGATVAEVLYQETPNP